MIIICKSLDEIDVAAKAFIATIGDKKIFAFNGEMGAGKTTFIKELCKQLGVTNGISSPTYSIVNEYNTNKGETVFHFDFYRIKDEQEAFDMGYEDYLYSNNICFIEWPEKIKNLLPKETVNVHLTTTENVRTINIDI
jgi:tRNA threonylcarbamoyladenosine biosynthesis protein TsaE